MLDLDAIRARLAAIRSTPWSVAADRPWVLTVQGHRLIGANGYDDILDRPEATFIAAAPADVAALLAEVERLRAENHGLHYIVAGTRGYKAEAGDYPPTESWRGMTLHITDPKPRAED